MPAVVCAEVCRGLPRTRRVEAAVARRDGPGINGRRFPSWSPTSLSPARWARCSTAPAPTVPRHGGCPCGRRLCPPRWRVGRDQRRTRHRAARPGRPAARILTRRPGDPDVGQRLNPVACSPSGGSRPGGPDRVDFDVADTRPSGGYDLVGSVDALLALRILSTSRITGTNETAPITRTMGSRYFSISGTDSPRA